MIQYLNSLQGITAEHLQGFFIGWKNAPAPEVHLNLLEKSDYKIIAKDGERVVGFITAITDGTLAAYIPFLEVLPEYQKQGIGKELVKQMLDKLNDFYMVDLLCDTDLQSFYEQFRMQKATGMMKRNYGNQSGSNNL